MCCIGDLYAFKGIQDERPSCLLPLNKKADILFCFIFLGIQRREPLCLLLNMREFGISKRSVK